MVSSPGMNVSYSTAAIANGASLSGAVNLGDSRAVMLMMPSAWTAAVLTFQVSRDGTNFKNLYDKDGQEYTAQAAADRAVLLPLAEWAGIEHIKIRSGTSGAAVNQTADRSIEIATVY